MKPLLPLFTPDEIYWCRPKFRTSNHKDTLSISKDGTFNWVLRYMIDDLEVRLYLSGRFYALRAATPGRPGWDTALSG